MRWLHTIFWSGPSRSVLPASLWTGRWWGRQRNRFKGSVYSLPLPIRFQQLIIKRREVWIWIKWQLRYECRRLEFLAVFLRGGGGGEGADTSPSKIRMHHTSVVLAIKCYLTLIPRFGKSALRVSLRCVTKGKRWYEVNHALLCGSNSDENSSPALGEKKVAYCSCEP